MEYITTTTVELFDGEVGLSNKQARLRSNKLMKIRKDVYQVLSKVQFKAGERISFSRLPKGLEQKLKKVKKENVSD